MRHVMKRALATTAFASTIAWVAVGCGDAPMATPSGTPEPQLAKGGKGKPPFGDRQALTATIVGDYASSLPPSGADDRILGDGSGSYFDGQQGVEAFNAESTWLDLRGSTTRTFWLDLRGAEVVMDNPEYPWTTADVCGTEILGVPTEPCESTQYFVSSVPDELPGKARFAAFWKDDLYQYRLDFGNRCTNELPDDQNDYVDVSEIAPGSGWKFTATTQNAYLRRVPRKGGGGKGHQCLGIVKVPFTVRFMLQ